jgi:hypothetical protein
MIYIVYAAHHLIVYHFGTTSLVTGAAAKLTKLVSGSAAISGSGGSGAATKIVTDVPQIIVSPNALQHFHISPNALQHFHISPNALQHFHISPNALQHFLRSVSVGTITSTKHLPHFLKFGTGGTVAL